MKLSEIKTIKETCDEHETNKFLAKGYKIIRIMQSKTNSDSYEIVRPIYILGK